MSTVEKIAGIIFFLIGVFIIIDSKGKFNTVLSSFGNGLTGLTTQLQGRGGDYRAPSTG